jgi:hypothetical protein
MRKSSFAVLLCLVFAVNNDLSGQQMTTKETTEFICKYKWFLRRYEWNDKFYTVPKEYQGTYMVFLTSGKVYYYKDGENESDRPRYDWKLSGDKISITVHEGTKETFKFKIEELIDYKIYITKQGGEYDGLTYVWEQAEKR